MTLPKTKERTWEHNGVTFQTVELEEQVESTFTISKNEKIELVGNLSLEVSQNENPSRNQAEIVFYSYSHELVQRLSNQKGFSRIAIYLTYDQAKELLERFLSKKLPLIQIRGGE